VWHEQHASLMLCVMLLVQFDIFLPLHSRIIDTNVSLAPVIRKIVLQRVAAFVKKFVWTLSVTRGLSEAIANIAGGRIFISGLSGLGIQSSGDDLDILCVVPKHVSRDDFFTVFKRMLRKVKGVSGILVSNALSCKTTCKHVS
jgi:hypothetical protein